MMRCHSPDLIRNYFARGIRLHRYHQRKCISDFGNPRALIIVTNQKFGFSSVGSKIRNSDIIRI